MSTDDIIQFDPARMNGQATVRDLRIPVSTVLRCLASGMSHNDILRDYPDLNEADIQACLEYAATLASDRLVHA
jgi:uncharacterized protein (DUF433 family)